MKKVLQLAIAVLLGVLGIKFLDSDSTAAEADQDTSPPELIFEIDNRVLISSVTRLGINLEGLNRQGTPPDTAPLILNPGFEGVIHRHLVIVSHHTDASFSDEVGLGYPDGFWDQAEFDIRTGMSAGKKGVVKYSLNSGVQGLPEYLTEAPLPSIQENDVIALTKIDRLTRLPHWQVNDPLLVSIDPYETRKESRGRQSVRLKASQHSPAEMQFHTDSIAERAGKRIPIQGKWHLKLWAKSEQAEGQLQVKFQRKGSGDSYVNTTLRLLPEWTQYSIEFTGKDQGPAVPLILSLSMDQPGNAIWVDDLILQPEPKPEGYFKKELVEALKLLHPSYLRELPGLGNTFENSIAPLEARRSWTFRNAMGKSEEVFSSSLVDFLELCQETGADPWLIVPPVFSDFECKQLGAFLSEYAPKSRFNQVVVEFGASSWNWLLRPLAIPYPAAYAAAADRDFGLIDAHSAEKTHFLFLVNGPGTPASGALNNLKRSKLAEGLATASYFFPALEKGTPDKEILSRLFQQESSTHRALAEDLLDAGKIFALSELNLRTIEGDAKAYERNRTVAGAASGSALAKKVIENILLGANPILIYNLGEFDTQTAEVQDFTRLSGLVSDFGPPLRWRPTGLAVWMLNRVIQGDVFAYKLQGESRQASDSYTFAPFKGARGWTAALVSASPKPVQLEIRFPEDGSSVPAQAFCLDTQDPFATNEEEERVQVIPLPLKHSGRSLRIEVPAWSLVILE